jgi:hypothetical protein
MAGILYDYKRMGGNASTLCFEIKPKAGYRAISPLVAPEYRAAKYHYTRFEIYQQLRLAGHISKGWEEPIEPRKSSNYRPLDMFSGDVERIQTALGALFDSPLNNLRAWFDGEQLIGTGTDDSMEDDALGRATESFFCTETAWRDKSHFCRLVVPLLAQVLLHEPLLAMLLKFQRLDIIDADGANFVFERLIELIGDRSARSAIEFVDAVTPPGSKQQTTWSSPLPDSPFPCPKESLALLDLCKLIRNFEERLADSDGNELMDAEMDEAHADAVRKLGALSKEECRYLLQNWLFSLVMCDVSLFLSLSPVLSGQDLTLHGINTNELSFSDDDEYFVRKQELARPGIVWNRRPVDSAGVGRRMWVYRLKIVDCDQKSAAKLKTRQAKENPIRFFQCAFH